MQSVLQMLHTGGAQITDAASTVPNAGTWSPSAAVHTTPLSTLPVYNGTTVQLLLNSSEASTVRSCNATTVFCSAPLATLVGCVRGDPLPLFSPLSLSSWARWPQTHHLPQCRTGWLEALAADGITVHDNGCG